MARRLLLLPGLGADERLFAGLGELCLPLVRVRLPAPEPQESFTRYALRVAQQLDLRPEDWIGGASFGSLVAADIARRRPLAGLVLIGGALSAASVRAPARWLGRWAHGLPIRPLRPLFKQGAVLSLVFGPLTAAQAGLLGEMLRACPQTLLRAGGRWATSYFPAIAPLCPVHAIHGSEDRLMHAPPLRHCQKVAGAGHALALTHAPEVTAFLRATLCD
jgi:hypothetical protein